MMLKRKNSSQRHKANIMRKNDMIRAESTRGVPVNEKNLNVSIRE